MDRSEDRQFETFRRTGEPGALAAVFDAAAPELWRVAWYLSGGDRHRAEDALQATFLTAIEDRGRWDSERRLRPWLCGILANHVRKDRRRATRAAPATEVLESLTEGDVADPADRAEVRAAVREALRGLPQPYREVVTLHLEHGLAAVEIAEALGRKPGTVRTQVVRGLDLVRKALPAGLAGAAVLTAPSAALAAEVLGRVKTAVLEHASTAAAIVTAASTVQLTWRSYVLISSLIVATVVVAFSWGGESDPGPLERTELVTRGAEQRTSTGELPSRELIPDLAPRPSVVTAPIVGDSRADAIVVRVVDTQARPRADEPVMLRAMDDLVFARTDRDGVVRFPRPTVAGHYSVGVVGRQASDAGMVRDGVVLREHELVITPGMHLVVRVVDADGRTVAGAEVEGIVGSQWQRMYNPLGCTDASGTLRMRDVGTSAQLRAHASGHQLSRFADVAGQVGEHVEVTLRLGGVGHAVTGRVVDADGEPLGGASLAVVMFDQSPRRLYVEADAEGRFRFDSLGMGRHLIVGQHRGDHLLRGLVRVEHPGQGEPTVELTLREGVQVIGTFLDADEKPVPLATISGWSIPEAVYDLPFMRSSAVADHNGRFVLDGLPAGPTQLRAAGNHSFEQRVTLVGDVFEWTPRAAARRALAVKLVDGSGTPLAGWRVAMRQENGYAIGMMLTTDAAGVAGGPMWHLQADELRAVTLHAPVPEGVEGLRGDGNDYFPTMVTPPLEPVGEPHVIRISDRARPNGAIEGRLLRRDGRVAGKVRVFVLSSRVPSGYETAVWTDAQTGGFRIAPLSPGRYRLRFVCDGETSMRRTITVDRPRVDLGDVRFPEVGLVRVRVRYDDAALVDDALQVRVESTGGSARRGKQQTDGSFLIRSVPRGPATIVVWGRATAPVRTLTELESDAVEVDVALRRTPPVPVVVVLPPTQARNQAGWSGTLTVRAADSGDLLVRTELEHSFHGRYAPRLPFELPLEPGSYRIEVRAWDGGFGEVEIDTRDASPIEIAIGGD